MMIDDISRSIRTDYISICALLIGGRQSETPLYCVRCVRYKKLNMVTAKNEFKVFNLFAHFWVK
jgi:hypothetical protein